MPHPATLVLLTGPPGTGKSALAEHAADVLGAPVLGWDWAMAALTSFDAIQESLATLSPVDHRRVGWSILWNLATAQLRQGRSVVLDGVARDGHISETRDIAAAAGADCFVIATLCSDVAEHERRLDGRVRAIPGWHELDWPGVANLLANWTPPVDADLTLDAMDSLDANCDSLARLLLSPGLPNRSGLEV
jgi:Predicted kinase